MFTFNTSPVFHANYLSNADIVVNQGGTDSTKTYSILQVLLTIAGCTKPPTEDPIITIVAESVPNLKKGAWRTAQNIIINNEGLQSCIKGDLNQSDRTIYFKTGWIMEFISVVDEQSAKQGKRQYLFVNEANGITWDIFWQLAKRTRIRTFIDYNPTAPFWAHEKLIGTTKDGNDLHAVVQLIISDHRHNPFLSEADHAKTENIKDPELHKVYARGLTGNLSGLIFPSWTMIPNSQFPWKHDKKFGALDFGYTNDPTAGDLIVPIGRKIFVHELCYAPGISATKLKKIFIDAGFDANIPVYCEHDPDMIRQLRTVSKLEREEEFTKTLLAIAARKGDGSLKAGIEKINRDYEVFYTESSKNIDYERKRYMWLKDPDTGKFTNTPIDKDNHHMDAIRMGIYTHFWRG